MALHNLYTKQFDKNKNNKLLMNEPINQSINQFTHFITACVLKRLVSNKCASANKKHLSGLEKIGFSYWIVETEKGRELNPGN